MHLLDNRGRFQLFLDTSKAAAGSPLYQIQNGTPKLIGYASKRLPPTAVNYSITGLELVGSHVNIYHFKHLLAKIDSDCTVHHLARNLDFENITEPASVRIKRILEVFSTYSLNLCYKKRYGTE